MKKLLVLFAAVALSAPVMAQEKYVVSAGVALTANKLDEAKENIDRAMANADTKDKPKALFVKAEVYMQMEEAEKYKASGPYKEAAQAIFRLLEVKPDYEKDAVNQYLFNSFVYYYNDGVRSFNAKNYADATDCMKNAVKIYNIGVTDKRFASLPAERQKMLDTNQARASLVIANCAYYGGQYAEAIPLLNAAKDNAITRSASVYNSLVDAYTHENKSQDALPIIQEGRKLFPEDATLKNEELNYYIKSGKNDEMVKKMEEAAAKDPQNAVLQFDIATTYMNMAKPQGGTKPANADELYGKAEAAYQKALALEPHNEIYNYNFASLYYNRAVEVNDQMNAITGTSDADQKKYDGLKAERDGLFAKSTPYFEEAYKQYSSKESTLTSKEKQTYFATVKTLKEMYARQGKMDKANEMKKKLESM